MPWNEASLMSLRLEFVALATAEGANVRELCRRYGISPKTAYKWIARHRAGGPAPLADRSRRPVRSPGRCPEPIEAEVLRLRDAHPTWGGRKLRARLIALDHDARPPAPSPPSSAAAAGSTPGGPPPTHRSSGSSTMPPIGSGRWTSRGTSPPPRAAATR